MVTRYPKKVAIVGGGLGGLMAAMLLDGFPRNFVRTTIFEASSRLGGKVLSKKFKSAPALFEAGVSELYDYSHLGHDPLRALIDSFGLKTMPMVAGPVVLDGKAIRKPIQMNGDFGKAGSRLLDFYRLCTQLYTPIDYYLENWTSDNKHDWADRSFSDVLECIGNRDAKRYITVATRSDLATEPHLTSGLNGLKNILMNDASYMRLYTIKGGIERLIDRLKDENSAEIRLDAPVMRVARTRQRTYQIASRQKQRPVQEEFDVVILALPNYWLSQIAFEGNDLCQRMREHVERYDKPAHYLRISCLFEQPFWRSKLAGSYFMHDAFDGCCVYDESSRYPFKSFGVLSWLLAGNSALSFSNHDDQTLISLALESLPAFLNGGQEFYLEGNVHRWVGCVNGLPGGRPVLEMRQRHAPARAKEPFLFVIGDYLIDSTLNAVVDSAEYVADALLSEIYRERNAINGTAAKTAREFDEYFDDYANGAKYTKSYKEYFCEKWTCDLIAAVWGRRPPYKLLDCGSANGLTLKAFAKRNVDAWGIENNEYIHAQTPKKWRSRNIRGDVRNLPFPDNSFDFIYETCLCYLPDDSIDAAIQELFRVCRIGVLCGSIATDMSREIVDEQDLFYQVRTFASTQQWAEFYIRNGFSLSIRKPEVLTRVWKIEKKANEGGPPWYPDADAMRYCFFTKPQALRRR